MNPFVLMSLAIAGAASALPAPSGVHESRPRRYAEELYPQPENGDLQFRPHQYPVARSRRDTTFYNDKTYYNQNNGPHSGTISPPVRFGSSFSTGPQYPVHQPRYGTGVVAAASAAVRFKRNVVGTAEGELTNDLERAGRKVYEVIADDEYELEESNDDGVGEDESHEISEDIVDAKPTVSYAHLPKTGQSTPAYPTETPNFFSNYMVLTHGPAQVVTRVQAVPVSFGDSWHIFY